MREQQLPTFEDLLWPTLKVLEKQGGSASIQELSEYVAGELSLSDDILDVLHQDGPESEVDYPRGMGPHEPEMAQGRRQHVERCLDDHGNRAPPPIGS